MFRPTLSFVSLLVFLIQKGHSLCPTVVCAQRQCERIFVDVRDSQGCAKFPCGLCLDSVVGSENYGRSKPTSTARVTQEEMHQNCVDDNTVKDLFGDTCSSFYNSHPGECGQSDTETFVASKTCCICKNSALSEPSQAPTRPPQKNTLEEVYVFDWEPVGEDEHKCIHSDLNSVELVWDRPLMYYDVWVRTGTAPEPCDVFHQESPDDVTEIQIAPASKKGKVRWKWTDPNIRNVFFYSKSHCLNGHHKVLRIFRCPTPTVAEKMENDVSNLFLRMKHWITTNRQPSTVQNLVADIAEPKACALLKQMDVVESPDRCVEDLQMLFQELPVVQNVLREIPELALLGQSISTTNTDE